MKTIIYGNGHMAKILYSYARRRMDVRGFTVDDDCIAGEARTFCGLPLLPFSDVQRAFAPGEHQMIVAVGFIEMNELRRRKHDEARAKGYALAGYVHESVLIHDDVEIAASCIVLEHVSIHPGSRIGPGTFISSNASIGHTCVIDEFNWINSGVTIAGGCRVGSGCFFGVNSSAGHNIQVGARNFIAANTLVNRSTRDDEVYVSAPGQLFRLKSRSFLTFSRILDP